MPLEMWAEGKKKKNKIECGNRNAECGIFRFRIWDFRFGIGERGALRVASYEDRIFEFGKPNKLNQLIQPNKRNELNDPNDLNDHNDINHLNEQNDLIHPNGDQR